MRRWWLLSSCAIAGMAACGDDPQPQDLDPIGCDLIQGETTAPFEAGQLADSPTTPPDYEGKRLDLRLFSGVSSFEGYITHTGQQGQFYFYFTEDIQAEILEVLDDSSLSPLVSQTLTNDKCPSTIPKQILVTLKVADYVIHLGPTGAFSLGVAYTEVPEL